MGTFLSDIVLQVLSFVAENERINIRQRQAEGIAAAKARGVKFGRPQRPVPENFNQVRRAWRKKAYSVNVAAKMCQMPTGTFYAKARIAEREETTQQFQKSTTHVLMAESKPNGAVSNNHHGLF